jgi:acyl dehydratase
MNARGSAAISAGEPREVQFPMPVDRSGLVGRGFPPVRCVLDEENVCDYVRIADEAHPAFLRDEDARAAGYDRRVIPPSLAPYFALSGLLRAIDWEKDFSLDYRTGTGMFGEQELEFLRPLYVGEALTIQGTVTAVVEKRGSKPFDLVTMVLSATDERGAIAMRGTVAFILFK